MTVNFIPRNFRQHSNYKLASVPTFQQQIPQNPGKHVLSALILIPELTSISKRKTQNSTFLGGLGQYKLIERPFNVQTTVSTLTHALILLQIENPYWNFNEFNRRIRFEPSNKNPSFTWPAQPTPILFPHFPSSTAECIEYNQSHPR